MSNQIAIITDTHFGARSNNKTILEHQINFLENVFFPTLEARGIKHVFHLGDLVESKTKIDIMIHNSMHEKFLKRLSEYKTWMIPGNHDLYYKDTLKINAIKEFASHYENIEVLESPEEIMGILMVPWICDENYEECISAINKTKCQMCFGHFEITGAKMHEGRICDHGLNKNLFNKFDIVLSGHFHSRSKLGNIEYIGNPHQSSWSDWNEDRGFTIVDLDTRKAEFIKNPVNVFEKITYNDSEEMNTNIDVNKKYVKVIVKVKNEPYNFEQFISKLESSGAIEVQVIEDALNLGVENADELIDSAENVDSLLNSYVDSLGLENKNEKVKKFLQELYKEAQLLEV